jgi:hypothetical protein
LVGFVCPVVLPNVHIAIYTRHNFNSRFWTNQYLCSILNLLSYWILKFCIKLTIFCKSC